jgi:hypothetical protein
LGSNEALPLFLTKTPLFFTKTPLPPDEGGAGTGDHTQFQFPNEELACTTIVSGTRKIGLPVEFNRPAVVPDTPSRK